MNMPMLYISASSEYKVVLSVDLDCPTTKVIEILKLNFVER